MARKAFSGDLVDELPRGKMEPYRLWFEYLKFALKTQPGRVNRKFYESWDNVETEDFDEWFNQNWKKLFAVPASVKILTSLEDANQALNEADVLLIKITNNAPIRRQLADFTKALASQKRKKISIELSPKYQITSKRSMSLDLLRALLKFLQILQVEGDIEAATKIYFKWAEDWNEKIKQKKWKRQEIFIPKPIKNLAERSKEFEAAQKISKVKIKRWEEYNTARSDVNRLKRKAEKVVSNVSKGIFPGDY
jgi:hypothetical protein